MSDFKSEVLPSGVLIRKIKDDDNNYVLTCQGQAIIVSKLDIARMDGIVYPTRRLSEKCCNVTQQADVPDINVEDIALQYSSAVENCEACNITARIDIGALDGVKQIPRHTCGIDGPNDNSASQLKAEYKPLAQHRKDPYEAEVRRIAEVLARIHYANAITSLYPAETWEGNPVSAKEWAISNKMDEARAMVAESAKCISQALKNYGAGGRYIESYLIERGLVPVAEVAQEGNCPDYSFQFGPCKATKTNPIGHPADSLTQLPTNERAFHCNVCGHTIKDPSNLIHL